MKLQEAEKIVYDKSTRRSRPKSRELEPVCDNYYRLPEELRSDVMEMIDSEELLLQYQP
ncbi:MAG: hypothetical protein ABEJ83_04165 [Candidatus Nanohaloarchaea archaeon]